MRPSLLVPAACLLLAACSDGSGDFDSQVPTGALEPLRVLDLDDGLVYTAPADFRPSASRLVFVRIAAGSSQVATSDTVTEEGPVAGTTEEADLPAYWLCAHEVTQAQWNRLARLSSGSRSSPWNSVVQVSAGGQGAVDGGLPAWGLDATDCETVFADWSAAHPAARLRLPTAAEWERAAGSADGAGAFGWGDAATPDAARAYAVVRETTSASRPAPVASRSALGNLFDIHGNVWEWVSDDGDGSGYNLRGGSWCDTLASARTGNRRACPANLRYALAGVRPVLVAP